GRQKARLAWGFSAWGRAAAGRRPARWAAWGCRTSCRAASACSTERGARTRVPAASVARTTIREASYLQSTFPGRDGELGHRRQVTCLGAGGTRRVGGGRAGLLGGTIRPCRRFRSSSVRGDGSLAVRGAGGG